MKAAIKRRHFLSPCFSIAMLGATATMLGACATAPDTHTAVLSKERVADILASPDRSAADRTNDIRRKPDQMLGFIGVRPGMVALDLSAGGGYTTELIARAVGPAGRVYGQSAPRDPGRSPPVPTAPEGAMSPPAALVQTPAVVAVPRPAGPRTSPERLAERSNNSAAGNIIAVVQPFESPIPAEVAADKLDLVTLMFNYHDLGFLGVDRAQMNKAVFAALKPGGMYVIADHSGRPGTGISESGTLHRIEEAFLRKEVEAAGSSWPRKPISCAIPRTRATRTPPTHRNPKTSSSSNS